MTTVYMILDTTLYYVLQGALNVATWILDRLDQAASHPAAARATGRHRNVVDLSGQQLPGRRGSPTQRRRSAG
jgi:hypothetical protein